MSKYYSISLTKYLLMQVYLTVAETRGKHYLRSQFREWTLSVPLNGAAEVSGSY